MAEFPSLRGVVCKCLDQIFTDVTSPFNTHASEKSESRLSLEYILETCHRLQEQHREAYNIMRRPAKEVIVAIISDLDRSNKDTERHHAIHVAYYMSGFSLKMNAVRGILTDIIGECSDKALKVKVVSFDGQFLEICTKDDRGNPLTMCTLQKDNWQNARKKSKKELLKYLFGINNLPCIASERDLETNFLVTRNDNTVTLESREEWCQVFTQKKNISSFVNIRSKKNKLIPAADDEEDFSSLILQHLPSDLIEALDTDSLMLIKTAAKGIVQKADESNDNADDAEMIPNDEQELRSTVESVLSSLKLGKTGTKYANCVVDDVLQMMTNGASISRTFSVPE